MKSEQEVRDLLAQIDSLAERILRLGAMHNENGMPLSGDTTIRMAVAYQQACGVLPFLLHILEEYRTQEEMEAKFGPTPEGYCTVEQWLLNCSEGIDAAYKEMSDARTRPKTR